MPVVCRQLGWGTKDVGLGESLKPTSDQFCGKSDLIALRIFFNPPLNN